MVLVLLSESLGLILFGLPGGTLLTKLGSRRTMILADGVRAPLTLVIGSLMIGWGLAGLAVTDTLHRDLHWPPMLFVGPALGAAAAGSLVMAKLFGELSEKVVIRDSGGAPVQMSGYTQGRSEILDGDGNLIFTGRYYDTRNLQPLAGDEALTPIFWSWARDTH